MLVLVLVMIWIHMYVYKKYCIIYNGERALSLTLCLICCLNMDVHLSLCSGLVDASHDKII